MLEQADVVYCDGTGVRLGARLTGQTSGAHDWGRLDLDELCPAAARQACHFSFLGGPGVACTGCSRIGSSGIVLRGCASSVPPPGTGWRNGHRAAEIELRPDIVLVGMGSPTQEKWIARHRAEIDVPVLWAVGALFDFVSRQNSPWTELDDGTRTRVALPPGCRTPQIMAPLSDRQPSLSAASHSGVGDPVR